jgi:hypothetical protein
MEISAVLCSMAGFILHCLLDLLLSGINRNITSVRYMANVIGSKVYQLATQ